MNLTTFMLPSHDDPTADHNQLSHVPREPLRASQNRVGQGVDHLFTCCPATT